MRSLGLIVLLLIGCMAIQHVLPLSAGANPLRHLSQRGQHRIPLQEPSLPQPAGPPGGELATYDAGDAQFSLTATLQIPTPYASAAARDRNRCGVNSCRQVLAMLHRLRN